MEKNYSQIWEEHFRKEILNELKSSGIELKKGNLDAIIKFTSFKERSRREPKKCPYYLKNPPSPCHEKIEDLNCFLCACPNYESEKPVGGCKINSKKGKFHYHKNLPEEKIWDCSDCEINHSPKEVKKYLLKNFEEIFNAK